MRARAAQRLRSGCELTRVCRAAHAHGQPAGGLGRRAPACLGAGMACPSPDGLSCHSRHRRIPYCPVIPCGVARSCQHPLARCHAAYVDIAGYPRPCCQVRRSASYAAPAWTLWCVSARIPCQCQCQWHACQVPMPMPCRAMRGTCPAGRHDVICVWRFGIDAISAPRCRRTTSFCATCATSRQSAGCSA